MRYEEELLLRLEERDEHIRCVEQLVDQYRYERDQMVRSRAWKLTQRLAALSRRVAPPLSRRRKAFCSAYRSLRALSRLGRSHHVKARLNTVWRAANDRFRPQFGRDPSPLRLERLPWIVSGPPQVSIVIPVFNHLQETRACLESIAGVAASMSFEVIVVDDGSTDETRACLEHCEAIVYLRNDRNQGFIASCNRGAAASRGAYLVFLNNDTTVTHGWLDALADTFRTHPDVGFVGAKLVYPDGRLQEAGGLIWRDASGWNYGKFDNPDHPRYNFLRETDYCSGACVMIPRKLFLDLGGFDSRYAPAYYEDVDLAFKIRRAGHKIVYQPRSRVIHHEGITSGTSLDSGVKSHQRVNQPKFAERWKDRLEAHPEPPKDWIRIVRSNGETRGGLGQILIVDHCELTPDRDCGSLRMLEILRAIRSRGHHVSFIPDTLSVSEPYLSDLQALGVEVIHHPHYESVEQYLREYGRDFQMVILSRASVAAKHITTVRSLAPQAKVVFDTVDLHFLRETRQAELAGNEALQAMLAIHKEVELGVVNRADMTLVVSPNEQSIVQCECPGIDVRVLPTIYKIDPDGGPGLEARDEITFIGGFAHAPNVDAVLYFAREILPRIRERMPECIFRVIGPDPPPEIRDLAGPFTAIDGYVADVQPLFHRSRVSVAPIRYGAGVKGKVNQSMSYGVPTVVTSIAAEGMFLRHEHDAMIADDPESFAMAVHRLWTDHELWSVISRNGRRNVREHFSLETAAQRIDELLAWAGLSGGAEHPGTRAVAEPSQNGGMQHG